MRLAVEFKRYGAARYVSHLDMQRTVMRAIRRTNLRPEYSQGFNPHMILSFASAMPVGLQSNSEYFELKLAADTPVKVCLKELRQAMPEGIEPVWAGKLADNAPKLMTALQFAGYEALIEPGFCEIISKQVDIIRKSDKIEVEIEKKGTLVKKDIRPLIRSIELTDDTVCMVLSFSSEGSLSPEVLLKEIAKNSGEFFDYTVVRTGLYICLNL